MECSANAVLLSLLAHQDHCVGIRQQVTALNRAFDELVQHRFMGGVKQQASDLSVVILVRTHELLVLPVVHSE